MQLHPWYRHGQGRCPQSRDGADLPHSASFDFFDCQVVCGVSSSCTTILRFIFAFIFEQVSYLVSCHFYHTNTCLRDTFNDLSTSSSDSELDTLQAPASPPAATSVQGLPRVCVCGGVHPTFSSHSPFPIQILQEVHFWLYFSKARLCPSISRSEQLLMGRDWSRKIFCSSVSLSRLSALVTCE